MAGVSEVGARDDDQGGGSVQASARKAEETGKRIDGSGGGGRFGR